MGIPGRFAFLLLTLLTTGSPLAGESGWSVIELRYRPAEELVPLIRPLLDPADAIVPNRNQLILRANPETVQEIRALLDQIDRSPHRLLISVAQDSQSSGESLGSGARIRGRIDLDRPDHSGVDIRGGAYRSEGRSVTGVTQQIQTLDGQSAVIQVGTRIPTPFPYGLGTGLEYQPVTTGFAVTPRLAGNRVLVEIEPWSDRPGQSRDGVIETRNAWTRVTAILGEWVEIAGAVEASVREQSGFTGGSSSGASRGSRILLKVEDLDAGKP